MVVEILVVETLEEAVVVALVITVVALVAMEVLQATAQAAMLVARDALPSSVARTIKRVATKVFNAFFLMLMAPELCAGAPEI